MKLWLKITIWCSASLLALVMIVIGLAMWLLTPERLTPLVNRYASQMLLADVNFESVDVSIWSDFPQVSLSLLDGNIVSRALAAPDTLLQFAKLEVSVDAWGLIRMKGASVSRFALSDTRLNAIIDSSGRASWDIVIPTEPDTDTTTSNFGFDLSELSITNGLSLTLFDARDSSKVELSLNKLEFRGSVGDVLENIDIENFEIDQLTANLTAANNKEELKTQITKFEIARRANEDGFELALESKNSARQGLDTLARELPVSLHSTFVLDFKQRTSITLSQTTLGIGSVEIGLGGRISLASDSTIDSKLQLKIPALSIQDLIGYIPRTMRGDLGKIDTDITLEFESQIQGSYNFKSGRLPHITATINADKGFLAYRGLKARVDYFALDATATYNPDAIALSAVELRQFEIRGSGIDLRASGTVSDILRDPFIDTRIEGTVDLTRLSIEFPSTSGITTLGRLELKSSIEAHLANLHLGGLAHTKMSATVAFRDIYINSPLDSIEFAGHGKLSLGANKNTRDSTIATGLAILRARVVLDTLNLKYGSLITVYGTQLNVAARTEASRYAKRMGKNTVPEFRGTISSKRLQMATGDSSLLRLNSPLIDFRVSPSKDNAQTPSLSCLVEARSVAARSKLSRYVMLSPRFEFHSDIVSREQDSINRVNFRLNMLQKRYPKIARKDLMLYWRMMQNVGIAPRDELASGDIDMKVSDDIASVLRRWRSTGRVQMRSLRIISPYMPLRTNVSGVDLSFNNDAIELVSSKFQVGRSDIEVSGQISNLNRALNGRGNLMLKLEVSGDTLDMNQLIIASNAGMNALPEMKQLITDTTSQEDVARIIEQQTAAQQVSNLVIIPKNIELNVALKVDRAYYGEVTMNTLRGELIARDRILQINHLKAESSIGAMELNAVYATRSKTDITTGFDIVLSGVNVGKLIDLIPSLDSMLPMLQSFEGLLDCKFAATASLDSTMNLLIPTLNAAGSISGKDMVLLDGKTFTEISKIMRFKNKSRNVVDKISVEMLIRNSAVELFPFILELDRYKAALSGVQKLDMSFDYHISVLKSIIPFRIGIDIYGNIDKWSFRITKARYKNENIPSYSALIDTTRIDLRRAITDIFATGMKNLVLRENDVVVHVDSTEMARADSMAKIVTATP